MDTEINLEDKIDSGIAGLDKLMYGGFPKERSYLISGEPGTGKTIFILQYLRQGLITGQKCIYISIDEKPLHVIQDAKALGWDFEPYLKSGQFQIIDVTSYFNVPKNGKSIDVDKIISDILGYVKKSGAQRLGIDPIAPLIFQDESFQDVVDYIRKLIFAIEDTTGCTTLLTSYVPVGSNKISSQGIEEFASSGIIVLKLAPSNNKLIRTIGIRKMRGTRIDLTEYSFEILPNRGVVLRQPV